MDQRLNHVSLSSWNEGFANAWSSSILAVLQMTNASNRRVLGDVRRRRYAARGNPRTGSSGPSGSFYFAEEGRKAAWPATFIDVTTGGNVPPPVSEITTS